MCRRFIFIVLITALSGVKAQVTFTSSNLPLIQIDTHGQSIPYGDPRLVGDMRVTDNGAGQRNALTDSANAYQGKIAIEIRGQSSASWNKKSYALETQNADGSNRNVPLLGLPDENDWILYGPYFDRSLLRNVLVFQLAREMGHYASRTRFCELLINGEYRGLYILLEKIKRDKNRVAIAKLDTSENSGDNLTGGYIVRVDKEGWKAGFDSPYPPYPGSDVRLRYQYVYPKSDEITPTQANYIKNFVLGFERHMYYNDYADSLQYFMDLDAAVDYLILNEISRNADGYRLSAYLHKQKDSDGGKLVTGPVWDYNLSLGNSGYNDTWLLEGWQLVYFAEDASFHQYDSFLMPFWWAKLFTQRQFIERLQERWGVLRTSLLDADRLAGMLADWADSTAEARERNFSVWPGPGNNNLGPGWFPPIPPGYQPQDYDGEMEYLTSWLAARMQWMDGAIPTLTSIKGEQHPEPASFHLRGNYPNPFNPQTTVELFLPYNGEVHYTLFNVLGQQTGPVRYVSLQSGVNRITLEMSDYPSGMYLFRAQFETTTRAHKLLFLK